MIAQKTGQRGSNNGPQSNGVFGLLRQPVVILDQSHRIVVASPPFHQLLGTTPQDTAGRSLRDICDGLLDVRRLQEFLDRVQSDPTRIDGFRLEVNKRLDRQRAFLISAQCIPVATSGKIMIVAFEEASQAVPEDILPSSFTPRAQLDNVTLSSMAAADHDLRQPLQTLNLLHGVLAAKVKDPELRVHIARIEEAAEALTGMLNTIATVSRLHAGPVSPAIQSFSIGSILSRLRTEIAYHADTVGLGWRVVPCSEIIRSDPRLLEHLLRAVLIDAMKLIGQGKLLLGCRRRDRHLCIQVWIKGTGVSAERQAALLSEFDDQEGASIRAGLAPTLIKRLSDRLHLAITARSRSGNGLVFSAKVPIEPRSAETTLRPSGTSRGTMVVTSADAHVRDILILLLQEIGHEALLTSPEDGFASITATKAGNVHPEIIIVDSSYGIELSKKIVTSLRWMYGQDVPAIVLGEREGMDDAISEPRAFLRKPVRPNELALQIARFLTLVRSSASRRLHRSDLSQTVFVVDDNSVLRDAVRDVLSQQGQDVELFTSSEAFLAVYNDSRRGCLIIDNRLPGMSGVALLERLKSDGANLPSIMITGHGDTPTAVRALKAGAIDYLEKPISYEALIAAVEQALAMDRGSANAIVRRRELAGRLAELTPREHEVLDLVVAGQSSKNIARILGISQRTVENHRAAIMKRANVTSLPDLIRIVMQLSQDR
ncbi:MAG: hypothetical protein C0484_23000 [Rhodospirillum sp.]|nr:hypothetical protein [Rhodospirillum sp.]